MTTRLVVDRAAQQRRLALERANGIRLTRAQIKRARRVGELRIADALELPELQGMCVADLLLSGHGWGKVRTRKALLTAGVLNERTRVAQLTRRQRHVLALVGDFRRSGRSEAAA